MSHPKPKAVLHECAGTLDVFKLHGGQEFLIVGHHGGACIKLPEWTARALHKWLGENLPREPENSSYAYDRAQAGMQTQANNAIQANPPPGASAYAEEAPLKRGSGEAMAAARALHERALDYANQRSQAADIELREAANRYAWAARGFSAG